MTYFSRSVNKHRDPYTLQHIYKSYIKEIEKNSPYDIKYSLFKDICNDYFKLKIKQLLQGGMFILPFGLGTITIEKKKPKEFKSKHLQIDWAATNKLGKVVHHTNDHSNYYKFRFKWSKKDSRCLNKLDYSLTFTRDNKRMLASIIKDGNTDFVEA